MELGFDLGGLLGAAGILTVAVGFASQTSASNVISGLFLLGERPFAVGDMIKVNGTVGEVLSIDMLAVKLLCLEERAPRALFTGYGESSLDHEFRVWAKTENFLDLRNSISIEIKEAFDEAEIEIPFPHRTLYVGSETEPFPHRKVDESSDSPSAAAPGESSGEPPSGRSS